MQEDSPSAAPTPTVAVDHPKFRASKIECDLWVAELGACEANDYVSGLRVVLYVETFKFQKISPNGHTTVA
jgi:hypothetical protein